MMGGRDDAIEVVLKSSFRTVLNHKTALLALPVAGMGHQDPFFPKIVIANLLSLRVYRLSLVKCSLEFAAYGVVLLRL
jgi:hypothetical protein